MRQIGTITDEKQMQRLADYLLTLGIRIQVEPGESGFAMWAIDEDRVSQAREELDRFQQNPDDERYAVAAREARRIRDEMIRSEKARQKNVIDVGRQWSVPRSKPLTMLLIVSSCIVTFLTRFGENWDDDNVAQELVIAEYRTGGGNIHWWGVAKSWPDNPLHDLPRFQFWRLITPIFLHVGPWHLVMNMMAMHVEGTIIESRRGTWRLALMVLLIAVLSNLAQYAYQGPKFGGMSGVGFGLFGYVWMKSEFDPSSGIVTSQSNVFTMLAWLVLCMTGLVGPIANVAHLVGLIVGMILGYGPVVSRRLFGR